MLSILGGIMIALGGIVNLQVGGIGGALFFSLGLITILMFKFDLFTGRSGLLATREITAKKLLLIWLGNLYGAVMMGVLMGMTPIGASMAVSAEAIAATRLANGALANTILGGCCGILMYIGVGLFSQQNNPLYAVMPVAIFILSGFNHCVADMFYFAVGKPPMAVWLTLIPTTVGNLIGTNIIPTIQKWLSSQKNTPRNIF